MAYHIKDPETDRIIRELAKIKQQPIAVVIKEACRKELEQEKPVEKKDITEIVREFQERFQKLEKTGAPPLPADKAFFDSLWEE